MTSFSTLSQFDTLLLALTALMVAGACMRGLTKELLHTLIFLGAMVAGTVFMNQTNPQPVAGQAGEATQAAFLTLNLAYYALAAYLLTSVFMKFVGPLLMKELHEIGLRSRLSAGCLALTKIMFTAVMLNVFYIAHAPEPNPTRLLALPEVLQTSTLLQLSDANWAQTTAEFLAARNIISAPLPTSETPDDQLLPPKPTN